MAVKHMVWLTFKPSLDAERIDQHMQACRDLAGQIPEAIDVGCGPNFTDRAGGYTHGIVATLGDRDALQAYLTHPAHVAVGAALRADCSEIRVMDIEV